MKRCTTIACLLLICMTVSAQTVLNLQQQVRLNKHTWPLDELLMQVTKQTSVRFSINTRKFPPSKNIYINLLKQTVAELLTEINKSTGIAWLQTGAHIILIDQKIKKASPFSPTRSTAGKKNKLPEKPVPKRVSTVPLPDAVTTPLPVAVPRPVDIAVAPRIASEKPVIALRPAQLRKLLLRKNQNPIHTILTEDITSSHRKETISSGKNNTGSSSRNFMYSKKSGFFASAGTGVDDVMYMQNTLLAGHTWFYGMAKWNTDFRTSGFRYGIGSSFPLQERWSLHLQFTTGKMNYGYDTAEARKELDVRWQQFFLQSEWKFAKHFRLQFGPVLHLFKGENSLLGMSHSLYVDEDEFYKFYHTPKPIIKLSGNYSESSTGYKYSWLGFQAGIFFTIDFRKSQ